MLWKAEQKCSCALLKKNCDEKAFFKELEAINTVLSI